MIIYNVINNKDNTIEESFLEREKALQSARDLMALFTDGFHVESKIIIESESSS